MRPAPAVLGLSGIQPGSVRRSGFGDRSEPAMRDPSPDGRCLRCNGHGSPLQCWPTEGRVLAKGEHAPAVRGRPAQGLPDRGRSPRQPAARSSGLMEVCPKRGMDRRCGATGMRTSRRGDGPDQVQQAGELNRGNGKEIGSFHLNPARGRPGDGVSEVPIESVVPAGPDREGMEGNPEIEVDSGVKPRAAWHRDRPRLSTRSRPRPDRRGQVDSGSATARDPRRRMGRRPAPPGRAATARKTRGCDGRA